MSCLPLSCWSLTSTPHCHQQVQTEALGKAEQTTTTCSHNQAQLQAPRAMQAYFCTMTQPSPAIACVRYMLRYSLFLASALLAAVSRAFPSESCLLPFGRPRDLGLMLGVGSCVVTVSECVLLVLGTAGPPARLLSSAASDCAAAAAAAGAASAGTAAAGSAAGAAACSAAAAAPSPSAACTCCWSAARKAQAAATSSSMARSSEIPWCAGWSRSWC